MILLISLIIFLAMVCVTLIWVLSEYNKQVKQLSKQNEDKDIIIDKLKNYMFEIYKESHNGNYLNAILDEMERE